MEPLVSVAKPAARDRTLNEWFKVSSERLSQLINLLMAVHVWTEAGGGGRGTFFRLLHHFKSRQKHTLPVEVVQRCTRSFGSQNPAGYAGPALFSFITSKRQKSVAAQTRPFTLSLQGTNERKESASMPFAWTTLHLEKFKIQEHFRWNPVWILVIIQLFWPQKKCFLIRNYGNQTSALHQWIPATASPLWKFRKLAFKPHLYAS